MSNMDKIKSMPYRLEEGALERLKFSSRVAIADAVSQRDRRQRGAKLGFSVALVACVVLALFVFADFAQTTSYEQFLTKVADAPMDTLYEMSADVVEYAEDITLFIN